MVAPADLGESGRGLAALQNLVEHFTAQYLAKRRGDAASLLRLFLSASVTDETFQFEFPQAFLTLKASESVKLSRTARHVG